MSLLAGLGGVAIEAILVGFFYFFDAAAKALIERHETYLLIIAGVVFVAAFGFSLQFALEMQCWRGKWK